MLSKIQIERFFVRFNIPIDGEKTLTETEFQNLVLSAYQTGLSFVCFLKASVLNPDLNGTNACFSSHDDLFECYCTFMTGYLINKNLHNN